ncbi:hypothetical protein FACS18949_02860 [Clostridia bacterium]|nr:hypothetical protein FACS18949_02860 [Clostridia bacterium]
MPTRNIGGYPEVQFVDTDIEKLVAAMVEGFRHLTGRTLYPADPERLFILWIASIIVQERVKIDYSAKQNIPRFAEGVFLDSIGEFYGDVQRLQPIAAKTTLRFFLSAVQTSAQTIPQGTRVSVDGKITFATERPLTISPGSLYGDMTAECLIIGAEGNGFAEGQISQIVDVYPYYESVGNITPSAGGADMETDDHYYYRMRESLNAYSTAGPVGAYVYFAMSAHQSIADVKATSPAPGIVDIRVLCEGGTPPSAEIIQAVLDKCSADTVRPLTDQVQVSAPDVVSFDLNVSYWIDTPNATSATLIQAAANAATEAYIAWQTSKMGRDINPSKLQQDLMNAGVKRVEISSPVFTPVADNNAAILGTKTVTYGGIENE